jgi:hypothetical protein
LPLRVSRAVSAWQDQLMRLTQSGIARRPGSGAVRDIAPVTVVTLVAMLGAPSSRGALAPAPGYEPATRPASRAAAKDDAQDKDGIGPVPKEVGPREVLASVIGGAESVALIAQARQDLRQRIGLLLDEEMRRFGVIIDEAGEVDAVAAVRLYQAEYSLEAAR